MTTATSISSSTTRTALPALLRNDTSSGNHWIRLELRGTRSNRDAVGTRVEVEVSGRKIFRQRKGGYSLESSNDPRLTIGVGRASSVDRVTLRWPSGATSTLEHLPVDRVYRVVEPHGGRRLEGSPPGDDADGRGAGRDRGGPGDVPRASRPGAIRSEAESDLREGRFERAAASLAMLRDPTPRDRLMRAEAARGIGRPDEALDELARIPDDDPASTRALVMAAEVELRRDRIAKAEAALKRASGAIRSWRRRIGF